MERPEALAGHGDERRQAFSRLRRRAWFAAAPAVVATILCLTVAAVTASPRSFAGAVEYRSTVHLNFSAAGRVAAILVKPGDSVTAGQPLAIEDDQSALIALRDASNVLVADEAVLASLKSPEPGSGAPASSDRIAAAEATVATAEAEVDQDRLAVTNLTLLSPISGTVVQIGGAQGDLDLATGVPVYAATQEPPSAIFQGGSGIATAPNPPLNGVPQSSRPLITLAAGSPVAVVTIPQTLAGRVHRGLEVKVHVDALGTTLAGTVREVESVPVAGGTSVDYDVQISIGHWPTAVLEGMTVHARFQ